MSTPTPNARGVLSAAQLDQFIHQGFVRLDEAFSAQQAADARALLWPAAQLDPDAPSTWTRPAIRLGMFPQPECVATANTPRMRGAFDQLVGEGRWLPCRSVGTFRIALPLSDDPGDLGWHVDVSFDFEQPDFLQWRANITSRGRALLMLMLFTDVGPQDAPTRLRIGSHHITARQLAPAAEAGLTLGQLAADGFDTSAGCEEALATGPAGTVYLCHPFLVHAAQAHHGARPRILAQPPLLPAEPLRLDGPSPVERAIHLALHT